MKAIKLTSSTSKHGTRQVSTREVGPFPTYPGKNTIEEFQAWVLKTGQPDLWEHHSASQPPRNQDYEEIAYFGIPLKLRPDVGMATCPICSPASPKYFEGALAWFPSEGLLRAIGNECARSHFGAVRANAATAAKKYRDAVDAAQYYLIDTLPKIGAMRDSMPQLEKIAAEVDQLRHTVWRRSSKSACEKLTRLGAKGILTIETTREVSVTDRFGKETTRHEAHDVATFKVVGLAFLRRKLLIQGLAQNTSMALERVTPRTEEQTLQFVVEELKNDQYLFDAEKLTRAAISAYENLSLAIAEARLFFRSENLNTLTRWSNHGLTNPPVIFNFNGQSYVHVRSPGKAGANVPIPMSVRSA